MLGKRDPHLRRLEKREELVPVGRARLGVERLYGRNELAVFR